MTDIEIANSIKKKDIVDVAREIGIKKDNLILYGNDKAKIINYDDNRKGHLILVTAISPTPMGEGKTTVSIGLNDALRKLDINVQFRCSVVSDSLRPHESQHARPPCPPPTPGVYSNSCPSSR